MDAASVRCEPTSEINRPDVRPVPADPCVMVIFGAAGDLTRADLLPSLYELHRKHLLPEAFAVISSDASARSGMRIPRRQGRRVEDGRRSTMAVPP
jgi:glucose-6-phosphate 1-dehydrogenase